MKIVDVRIFPVWIAPRNRLMVKVETDQGYHGWGESGVVGREMAVAGALRHFREFLIGRDPMRIGALWQEMYRGAYFEGGRVLAGAISAVDIALHDLVGKKLGVPVYQLLGGKVRERIPLSYSIPFGEPEAMAALAAEKVRAGHRTIKVKVGSESPARDIAAVRKIRDAIGPDVKLRVDGNMGWPNAKHAVGIIRRMECFDLELVEQPLPAHDLAGMAEIRRAIGVPLMADESVRGPISAMQTIRAEAADIANVYVTEAGGLLNASRIFSMCEAAAIPCMIGSMPEFGIGTAAQIHLGVAMPNLGPDSDTCGVLYHEEDLLVRPLRIEDGFAYPPEGPGLGIEIDMAVLERWRARAGAGYVA